jgi:hypothetical protein
MTLLGQIYTRGCNEKRELPSIGTPKTTARVGALKAEVIQTNAFAVTFTISDAIFLQIILYQGSKCAKFLYPDNNLKLVNI